MSSKLNKKNHAEGLYRFVTERQQSTKSAEESLTNDIDAQFQGGFTINTNAHLNRFMADYDIIRVLKSHVGYKSWDEVSSTEREYCFKNYSPKSGLPMWNTFQENYAWVKILTVCIFLHTVVVTEGSPGKELTYQNTQGLIILYCCLSIKLYGF